MTDSPHSPQPPAAGPLKVLQLCAVDFTLDKFLAPLCFRLIQEGFDVTAACAESEYMAPLRERGLRCVDWPVARTMNVLSHARSYRRLSAWLARERFDIVHVHTPIAALIGRLAAFRRRVPLRLYTAHGFYFHDDTPWPKRRFHLALEQFGGLLDHFLFTQSDEDRQTAIRRRIARADRVRTIGNGVDTARFAPERFTHAHRAEKRAELGIAADDKVLCVIGRLVREKGYFELFEAAASIAKDVPDFRLLVIGDALASDREDSTRNLEALVDRLGIRERIVFAGRRDDVPELLHASDVFTLPSHREGMPRSVIEAMAMGLPVVATDIRGCREEVVDGETGRLVPARDAARLAESCAALLADPALARRMGAAGLERARREFSEEKVLDKQIEIYRRLIDERLGKTQKI